MLEAIFEGIAVFVFGTLSLIITQKALKPDAPGAFAIFSLALIFLTLFLVIRATIDPVVTRFKFPEIEATRRTIELQRLQNEAQAALIRPTS